MRKLLLSALLGAVLFVGHARAVDFYVTNVSQFNAAVPQARPGDTITLANGTWTNADLVFEGAGKLGRPITLRAKVNGRVLLTGSSQLHLGGQYLVAQGLVFSNGYPHSLDVIEFKTGLSNLASNCRVTDCAIINFNPPNPAMDSKWVSIYGLYNQVDHCYFTGKMNTGTLLVVWLPPAYSPGATTPNYHHVDHNYFGPRPLNGGNGGEIIRVGDSATSFNISRTTVEYNYFESCDGEIEIISNKSCENVYRYNTFVECAGTLTLRHGNRCLVDGNFFLGNNKASTGGVRVMGEDHKVLNNTFQNLTGSAGYSALTLMQGLNNSPLNGFFQVRNAVLAFNTIAYCANSLVVGLQTIYSQSGVDYPTTLPPQGCRIANNIVVATQNDLVMQPIPPLSMTWEGNIMFGTTLGIGPRPGILTVDPLLTMNADGLWRPGVASPALAAAQGSYSYVTDDIRGRLRPLAKDVGCDQANGTAPLRRALSAADVGTSWQHPLTTVASVVNVPVASLRWPTVPGAVYQVQGSVNCLSWTNIGPASTATNTNLSWEELISPMPFFPPPGKFYRLKKLSGPQQPPFSIAFGLTNRPGASVQWNCVPGCVYQLQVSTNLLTWQDVSPIVTNTGTLQVWQELLGTSSGGTALQAKFFRVKQFP